MTCYECAKPHGDRCPTTGAWVGSDLAASSYAAKCQRGQRIVSHLFWGAMVVIGLLAAAAAAS